jgi:hypothetical protein
MWCRAEGEMDAIELRYSGPDGGRRGQVEHVDVR